MKLLEHYLSTILSRHTKIGTLVQQSITYAWTHIHHPLSMVVTSSQDKAINWTNCMALIMSFFTWMCINSISTQLAKASQCMVGLFGTLKLTNNSCKVSYSNIGWPWARTWNKVFIWTIFQFPSPIGLFVWAKTKLGPLQAYHLIFFKWA